MRLSCIFYSYISYVLNSSPVSAVRAWGASTAMERRSKIVAAGNESISGLPLTHWYFYCMWVILHSSHLNYDSWQDAQQAHTHTHTVLSKSWLSLKTKDRQQDEGKSQKSWSMTEDETLVIFKMCCRGCFRLTLVAPCHIILPQCGSRLEVDY